MAENRTLAGRIPSAGAAHVSAPNIVPAKKTGKVKTSGDLRTGGR